MRSLRRAETHSAQLSRFRACGASAQHPNNSKPVFTRTTASSLPPAGIAGCLRNALGQAIGYRSVGAQERAVELERLGVDRPSRLLGVSSLTDDVVRGDVLVLFDEQPDVTWLWILGERNSARTTSPGRAVRQAGRQCRYSRSPSPRARPASRGRSGSARRAAEPARGSASAVIPREAPAPAARLPKRPR